MALIRGDAYLLEDNIDGIRAEAMHWYEEALRLGIRKCCPSWRCWSGGPG